MYIDIEAYADLYSANEYAHRLGKDEITSKLKTLTGAAADDRIESAWKAIKPSWGD